MCISFCVCVSYRWPSLFLFKCNLCARKWEKRRKRDTIFLQQHHFDTEQSNQSNRVEAKRQVCSLNHPNRAAEEVYHTEANIKNVWYRSVDRDEFTHTQTRHLGEWFQPLCLFMLLEFLSMLLDLTPLFIMAESIQRPLPFPPGMHYIIICLTYFNSFSSVCYLVGFLLVIFICVSKI